MGPNDLHSLFNMLSAGQPIGIMPNKTVYKKDVLGRLVPKMPFDESIGPDYDEYGNIIPNGNI